MISIKRPIIFLIALAVLTAIFMAGCGAQPELPTPAIPETPEGPSAAATPAPTATPAPLAVLLSPPGSDPQLVAAMEETMRSRLGALGWQVETRSELATDGAATNLRLVAISGAFTGAGDLAAALPGVDFFAVGTPGVQAAGNLWVVGNIEQAAQTGFIAGYTAAVITQDWRVAVISTDSPDGQQYRQGFLAGVRYFCGLCLQTYPPYYEYPLSASVPAGASSEQVQAAVNQLAGQSVKTIYLAPGTTPAGIHEYLSQAGMAILSSASPGEPRPASWVARLDFDLAGGFSEALDVYLRGEPLEPIRVAISLLDINQEILSPGKIQHIELVIEELGTGMISPLQTVP